MIVLFYTFSLYFYIFYISIFSVASAPGAIRPPVPARLTGFVPADAEVVIDHRGALPRTNTAGQDAPGDNSMNE